MDDVDVMTASQKQRLESLLGSWQLRERANMHGDTAQVLRGNISALKSALNAADFAQQYQRAFQTERERAERATMILEEVRATLDEFARFRGPRAKRVDMAALANRIQDAFSILEGQ